MTDPTPTTPVGQADAREADPQVAALVDAMAQILDDMEKGGLCVCGLAKAEARIAYEPFNTEPEEWEPSYTYEEAAQCIIESEEAYGKRSLMRDVPKPQRRAALAAPDPAERIAELKAEPKTLALDIERRYPSIKKALASEYAEFRNDFWLVLLNAKRSREEARAAEARALEAERQNAALQARVAKHVEWFDEAYAKAIDWLEAALLGQQLRNALLAQQLALPSAEPKEPRND